MLKKCLFDVLLLVTLVHFSVNAEFTVKIDQGQLQGVEKVSTDGITFMSFTGIPYAEPPIGKLRFQPPQPPQPWKGVLNATVPGSDCIQFDIFFRQPPSVTGKEDCLFLNVYTRNVTPKEKRAVMLFIHGGAFVMGTGSPDFMGPKIIMNRDVVLVTINYRLGIMGFLSTGNSHISGNMGLKDQVMALKWVQENIAHFGGDSDKVTIFGLSAGGASVHYHMLSPMSKGLFHRAISLSGSALCSWAYLDTEIVQMRAKKLAALVDCPQTLNNDMLQCLLKKDAEDIVKHMTDYHQVLIYPLASFGPTLERDYNVENMKNIFLSETPYYLTKKGKVHPVPYMTGMTSNEGVTMMFMFISNNTLLPELYNNWTKSWPIILDYQYMKNADIISEKIKQYYVGSKDVTQNQFMEITEVLSDRMFNHGIYQSVVLQHESGISSPIYVYKTSYKLPNPGLMPQSISPEHFTDFGFTNIEELGVGHGEDGMLLFSLPFGIPQSAAPNDRIFSKNYLDLIVTFSETGTPHPQWKAVSDNFEYFDLNINMQMKRDFPIPRMDFWSALPITYGGKKVSLDHQKQEL